MNDDYIRELSSEENRFLAKHLARCAQRGWDTNLVDSIRNTIIFLDFVRDNRIHAIINPRIVTDRLEEADAPFAWLDHAAAFITKEKGIILTAHVYDLRLETLYAVIESAEALDAMVSINSWSSWWNPGKTILVALKIPH